MAIHIANLPNLVIASSGTTSNAINGVDGATSVTIFGPATLTGTATVQGSPDGTNFFDLQSGGSDITIATGSNAATILNPAVTHIRVVSAASEAASRTFLVAKTFQVQ